MDIELKPIALDNCSNKNNYGTTNGHCPCKKYKYVTHTVQPTDTLQGIALKYGVSMEAIKRENKLFTNDFLCIKKKLHIPIKEEDPLYSNHTHQAEPRFQSEEQLESDPESSSDFLSRIDSHIEETRNKLKCIQRTST
ncbi:LYSMD2 [Cordylochernes scorpioides]|uniref:LYSMD2 n=1 Tax=Cordylochernes scorpioides TaxID=51811 RepID=A0ABY6LNG8_9ARAC|nr:LYSMD2 [Cordylochernes scorpioides]